VADWQYADPAETRDAQAAAWANATLAQLGLGSAPSGAGDPGGFVPAAAPLPAPASPRLRCRCPASPPPAPWPLR